MAGFSFQTRVRAWMLHCFNAEIAADKLTRNFRFLEEAIELVQACGCTATEAHQLVDYVFGRPIGDPPQEVGGVMVTLATLCDAQGIDLMVSAETELARIWSPEVVAKIREKQATKPNHSPLPGASGRDAWSAAQIRSRIKHLDRKIAGAQAWGSALGAMDEERTELQKRLNAMTKPLAEPQERA